MIEKKKKRMDRLSKFAGFTLEPIGKPRKKDKRENLIAWVVWPVRGTVDMDMDMDLDGGCR